MTQVDKQLQKMLQNSRNLRIENIQAVATYLLIDFIHDGGSHFIFPSPY